MTAGGLGADAWVDGFVRACPHVRRVAPEQDLAAAAVTMRGAVMVFDLVSLGMAGTLACHFLSQVEALRPVPKVAVVGCPEDEERAYSAGAHVVLVGAPEPESLARLVQSLVHLNRIEEVEDQATQLQLLVRSIESAYDATIEGWVKALDLRDRETEEHSVRVARLTVQLAERMGYDQEQLTHVYRGALLHDIGKLAVPDAILQKSGSLTQAERALMQLHPEHAYHMLSQVAYLSPAIEIPYGHHERWDGDGYPNRLSGEEIPLAARIFSVIDVYDALRFDRPYRKGWPEAQVREHISGLSGSHFDPRVVQEFLAMLGDFDLVYVPA